MAKDGRDPGASVRDNARGIATRGRLLEAAVKAFSARGFHATSTRDIADLAGMSPAVLYAHYKSKEQLLFQISAEGHRDVAAVTEAAIAGVEAPEDRLTALMRAFTAWHAECHESARVIQYELGALTPEHLAEIARMRREVTQAFRDVIADGMDRGVFVRRDVGLTSMTLLSLGIDVARWYRPNDTWTVSQIAEHYSQVALRMVVTPGAD